MDNTQQGQGSGESTGEFRSGVAAIIGPPNAGKSTLLNRLLGQKIAIVTPKPQTTRNRIMGIVTGTDHQILLLDTPGLHKARDLMNKEMVRVALDSAAEADVILFLVDASGRDPEMVARRRLELAEYCEDADVPVILALNKIDLLAQGETKQLLEDYGGIGGVTEIVALSALSGENLDDLTRSLVRQLPLGPQYYPDDLPTDATERFIVAEIIREKIFLLTREEVPYATAVLIDSFQESDGSDPVVIHATILVERSSQKGIIIGHRGAMLGEIRKSATTDIRNLLDCPVKLQLWVKVKKKWTDNQSILRELGLR